MNAGKRVCWRRRNEPFQVFCVSISIGENAEHISPVMAAAWMGELGEHMKSIHIYFACVCVVETFQCVFHHFTFTHIFIGFRFNGFCALHTQKGFWVLDKLAQVRYRYVVLRKKSNSHKKPNELKLRNYAYDRFFRIGKRNPYFGALAVRTLANAMAKYLCW